MTVDVCFGKRITEGEEIIVAWPSNPVGDDGTSREFTLYPGEPLRSFSISGFYDWVYANPIVNELRSKCKPLHPSTQDREITLIDEELLCLIDQLPNDTPLNRDRARWFQYWARQASKEFGPEAAIEFS